MENDPLAPRREAVRTMKPHLHARLTLYPVEDGQEVYSLRMGRSGPCGPSLEGTSWSGFPIVGDTEMRPGETREVPFVFLVGEQAAVELRAAGRFYLWAGRLIGEATVVD